MRKSVLLAVSIGLLASCAGEVVTVSDIDSTHRLELDVGDRLEVRLASNPSTGFGWQITEAPEALILVSDEYVEPDSDRVGAAGTQLVVFEVEAVGAGVLRFEYVRPFDDPPVPDRVAEYVVVVADATWPPEPSGPPPGTSSERAP